MHIISSSEIWTKSNNQSNQKGVDSTDAMLNFQLFQAMVQVKMNIKNRFYFWSERILIKDKKHGKSSLSKL